MKREINSTPNDATNGSDPTQQYVIGYRALQAVIGGIAISLVLVVYFGNWLIFTHRVPACLVPGSHLPGSLSGFYYTHMRNVFVGAMSAMGVFFVAYKGYDSRDTWFTNVAGAAAIGIALCPTTPPGGDVLNPTNPCGPVSPVAYHASKYASVLGHVHAAFLGVLFAMVFFMLLLQFTKTTPGVDPELPKKQRNLLYRICAWAIFADALFVGVVTLVTHFEPSVWHGTSWLIYSEAFAFLAFGVAWFVKGRQGIGPFLRDKQSLFSLRTRRSGWVADDNYHDRDLPAIARGRKGRVRVDMAAELLGAHGDGRARVAIGRASDYYGPRGTGSVAGDTVFERILAGKKPQWPGRLDQPHTFQFLPDIARGLLVLADHREADGQIWHVPAAEPLTAQQFFDMVAQAAGRPVPAQASVASPALLAVAGIFSPLLWEMRETAYQFRAPFVIDSSKFEAAFGRLKPTPHFDAVEQTVAWYRSR